jgi:hypothetical protein
VRAQYIFADWLLHPTSPFSPAPRPGLCRLGRKASGNSGVQPSSGAEPIFLILEARPESLRSSARFQTKVINRSIRAQINFLASWRRCKTMQKRWPLPSISYRIIGVPVNDVFGPSHGFRHSADMQFIEPGLSFQFGEQVVFFSTGILTYVNVKPNPNVTDATIPKYIFNMAFSRRVSGHKEQN